MATKRAHILWQGYLKNFTDTGTKEGKIFCYNLEKSQYIDSLGVSTKGLGWRSCTYSQRDQQSKKRDDQIEQEFSHIESNVTSGIDTVISILNDIQTPGDIIDRKKINENDIINFILLLMTKTVGERTINHPGIIKKLEENYKKLLNDDEFLAKGGEKEIKKINLKNKAKELFNKFLRTEKYIPIFIKALKTKNWMFSYIRDENHEFCVSDFPIYLRPDNNNLDSFTKDPKVEITIPLSNKILLSIGGGFKSKREYTILTAHDELKKMISQANQMIIANAKRYIAGSRKKFIDNLISSKTENPYAANFFSSIDKILSSIQKNKYKKRPNKV